MLTSLAATYDGGSMGITTRKRYARRSRSHTVAVAIMGLTVSACGASDSAPGRPAAPTAVVASASGAFTLTTFPGDARAGLRYADFVTRGTVVVENRGRKAGPFAVRQRIAYEQPAAGPERASTQVDLRVLDVTDRGPPREVYAGAVAGLKSVAVGRIATGASRRFSFKLTPRDPLSSSSLDLSYRWVPEGASGPAPEGSDSDSAGPPDGSEADSDPGAPADGDRPRLDLRLQVPPKQRVLDTRRIRVLVRCGRDCRVNGRATLLRPGRRRVVLPVAASAPSALRRKTRLVLSVTPQALPVIRKALADGPPVAISLSVTARAGDGASAEKTERIRLKPAPDG